MSNLDIRFILRDEKGYPRATSNSLDHLLRNAIKAKILTPLCTIEEVEVKVIRTVPAVEAVVRQVTEFDAERKAAAEAKPDPAATPETCDCPACRIRRVIQKVAGDTGVTVEVIGL